MRINKYIASSGIASRRGAEALISEKRVRVNGTTVTDLSTQINPDEDIVKVDNKIIKPVNIKYYVLMNKPKGFITTMNDPFDRRTIKDLIPDKFLDAGVHPVGRLDKDTSGLILLTNDGELSNKMMHPRYNCEKEYIVKIHRDLEEHHKLKIEKGIYFREFHAKPCKIEFIDEKNHSTVKITLSEGKKRQIRITFAKFGYKVRKLKRITVGPLKLGNLSNGMHRRLKEREVKKLLNYVNL